MSDESDPKAVGKSISFKPFAVYTDAETFGLQQEPQMNVSQVICAAVPFYLEAKGFNSAAASKRAELLAAVAEMGESRALEVLQRAARRRQPAAA